jgi:long-chain acyl-CoA synthetase
MIDRSQAPTLPALFRTTLGRSTLEWFADDLTPAPEWETPDVDASGWCTLSGPAIASHVRELAAGLIDTGVAQSDRVALMLANRPEHWLADLAVLNAGGVPITFYPTLSPEQLRSQAKHARITTAIIEGGAQIEQWSHALALPMLRRIIVLHPDDRLRRSDVAQLSYAQTLRRGAELLVRTPGLLTDRIRQVRPDDPATIIFTSGTTGTPKAVPLTHRNIITVASGIKEICGTPAPYRSVSFLPTAHIVDRISNICLVALLGGQVGFSASPSSLNRVLERFRPTVLVGVPRIWEKLHVGLQQRAQGVPDKSVLAAAGLDQLSLAITAGAPMPLEVSDGLETFGLHIVNMWGLTETAGPVCISSTAAARRATVGRPLPGTDVRLADDGELLVSGAQISPGYVREDGSVTPITDTESWLATGDIGAIDVDGYVRIVGRKKEIIVTSGGKNISPASIEARLTRSPVIAQALAFGDGHPYVVALLTLDTPQARRWLHQEHGVDDVALTDDAIAAHPLVLAEIGRTVMQANTELARVEQVKRWHLLNQLWDVDHGTLTPSLKLCRPAIHAQHHTELAGLYAHSAPSGPASARNSDDADNPPGLKLSRLEHYLNDHCRGLLSTPISASLIEGGRSNLTYVVSDGTTKLVVRRPPLGNIVPTAYDVAREHKIIQALSATTIPVPRPFALCTDHAVIGAPFVLMEFVTGTSYRTDAQLDSLGAERTRAIAEHLVDTLVDLHALDPVAVGLSALGRADGFVLRQLQRWTSQLNGMRTRDVSGLRTLAQRLAASVPDSGAGTIVHGDYRLDNVLVDNDRIAAVLDWEMSTLGDPLTDLAILIAYGQAVSAGVGIAVGSAPGYPSAADIAERYARRSGADIAALPWYLGFAFFKLAVIAEGIHGRYTAGHTVGAGFENAGTSVAPLIKLATAALKEYQ